MRKYAVMYEVEYGEWMYSTYENPFTYNSAPIIFDSYGEAEDHAKKYNTSTVVLMHLPTNPISKVIKGDKE